MEVDLFSELGDEPAPGAPRWGSGFWVFWTCVGGGAIAGNAAVLYNLPTAASFAELLPLALAVATVWGVILGIPTGMAVAISGAISRRLVGSPGVGLVVGVVTSTAAIWIILQSIVDLIPVFAVFAVGGSVVVVLVARAVDRRNAAEEVGHVVSNHDVDTGEAS